MNDNPSPGLPVQLDASLNYFPDTIQHIHIMGACGTGMGALAGMLKSVGFHVTGSDNDVYPPMSDFLAEMGVEVKAGYSADNLIPHPDLVIVGNVITRLNPEALGLVELSLPYVSFPQALAHYFLRGKQSLVVAGTHGKTTTSSLLATLLHDAGLSPGFMIGGLVQAFGRNYSISDGDYFVVEGDEYDTAFFDKGPKFLHYQPRIAIITSIEFDHADIYADLAAVKNSFVKLVDIMPEDGCIVAMLDDPVVREIVAWARCPVMGYGMDPTLPWAVAEIDIGPGGTEFTVLKDGRNYGRFGSIMPGRHNVMNSLAVIGVLDQIGVGKDLMEKGLRSFRGVKRRQEVRGTVRGVTVIDDFAHHPTAVRETLEALKSAYAGRRLFAVFEPRTNSSRRNVFQQEYIHSFDQADIIVIKEPSPLEKIPVEERFSARILVEDLRRRKASAHYCFDTDTILEYLESVLEKGDVVAILSNGGFDDIHVRLLRLLAS